MISLGAPSYWRGFFQKERAMGFGEIVSAVIIALVVTLGMRRKHPPYSF